VVASGVRAYTGAPPEIPHSTWMRETCLACHGGTGAEGLRTRHPQRQSCTQCHAPSAGLNQGPVRVPGTG
jgi:cytochrome c-type protein NapB